MKTSLPGPKAKAIIERDGKVVSPSYTRDYPLVIARGDGAVVEDVDGNVFLDCTAGIAVTSTGHSHPEVVQAIVDQAQKFLHMSGTDFYYEPQVRLAEELSAIAPMQGRTDRSSATRAPKPNEAALKLAKYYTRRQNVIAFLGAFHGRSMGSLAATASKVTQRKGFSPLVPGTYHAPYPDCYRCPVNATPDSCAAECLNFIEQQLFVHLVSPDEVAAVIVEPIQGEGGYIVPPNVFLQRLRELTQPARHPAHRRRSAVGHGAHGADVRDRACRRRARHRHHREGDCVGAAARRGRRRRPTSCRGRPGRTPARLAATPSRARRRWRRSGCCAMA